VVEKPLTIQVNDVEIATLLCSPDKLDYLTLGFLKSEGLIESIDGIDSLDINEDEGIAKIGLKDNIKLGDFQRRIITSGCLGFYSKNQTRQKRIQNNIKVNKDELLALMAKLEEGAVVFRETGGTHSSALCSTRDIIFQCEDIGRHNTLDKIIGYIMSEGIDPSDKIIATTGRLSSEMVLKAVGIGIPVVVSRSAPTDTAVTIAENLNIMLIGFARAGRLNIYSNPDNVSE